MCGTRESYLTALFDTAMSRAHGGQLTVTKDAPPWQSVFYSRPHLDITDDIIALVNGK